MKLPTRVVSSLHECGTSKDSQTSVQLWPLKKTKSQVSSSHAPVRPGDTLQLLRKANTRDQTSALTLCGLPVCNVVRGNELMLQLDRMASILCKHRGTLGSEEQKDRVLTFRICRTPKDL